MLSSVKLRKILLGLVLITVGVAIGGYIFFPSTTRTLLHDLNLTLQEANGKATTRRLLLVNRKSLKDLPRVDIAASIRPGELDKLLPDLIERTNAAEDFKKQRIEILGGTIIPGPQQLMANIQLRKSYPDVELELKATANAAVGASQETIFFGLYFDRLEVTKVRITSERFDVSSVTPALNGDLKDLMGVINVVFDREINKKKALGARLKLPPLYAKNLKEENTKNLQFESRQVDIFATISQAAALVTTEGVVVLAAAENKKPDDSESAMPVVDGPTSMTDEEVTKAISEFQSEFSKRFSAAFGPDAPDFSKKSFLLIGRAYAARTLNDALMNPISAKGNVSEDQPPFSSPIANSPASLAKL